MGDVLNKSDEMNTALYFIAILIIGLVFGVFVGQYAKEKKVEVYMPSECSSDSDCSWQIVNCCTENAGARWQCINLNFYKKPNCPSTVICPQVISPKPNTNCVCKEGSCVVR